MIIYKYSNETNTKYFIHKTATIRNLKELITKSEGIHEDDQVLVYANRELENNLKVQECIQKYNLASGDTILLIVVRNFTTGR